MKFNDLTKLLEQDESIFQPRKMEDRKTRYIQQIQKQIQDYINNGSKGNLNLFRTPIQTLPAGLKVGGNLSLTNTQIKTLPDGLEVGGDLYLYDTPIQTLPDGLEVGGDLWLLKTPIAKQYDRQQLKQMYPGVKGHINI
jgi:hypothetical protein